MDLTGTKRVITGTQLSQSSRFSLQTPYILFGLGHTSNYIEACATQAKSTFLIDYLLLPIGLCICHAHPPGNLLLLLDLHYSQFPARCHTLWAHASPHVSILCCSLHLFSVSQLMHMARWQLELYINPSGMTLWVILAVVSCLVVLALVISLLQWHEKVLAPTSSKIHTGAHLLPKQKQDEQLKKENDKIFSFSPLWALAKYQIATVIL